MVHLVVIRRLTVPLLLVLAMRPAPPGAVLLGPLPMPLIVATSSGTTSAHAIGICIYGGCRTPRTVNGTISAGVRCDALPVAIAVNAPYQYGAVLRTTASVIDNATEHPSMI